MSDTEQAAAATDANASRGTASAKSRGAFPSVLLSLALVIALGALLLGGWATWRTFALQDLMGLVSNDLSQVSSLTRRLDQLDDTTRRQREMIDDLSGSLESGLSGVPELSVRIKLNEQRLAAVSGVGETDQSAWLITEAIYYLQIANVQIALAGNAQIAASALQLADDRLRDATDPALLPVRARLSDEMAALNAIPVIDRTGMSFRLKALARQAHSWPFQSAAPDSFSPEIVVPEGTVEQTAWERVVAIFKAVLNSIVSIKETDAPRLSQLSSAEQALIVEVVKAELQVARLALVGSNSELFTQSLESVTVQVSNYFDGEAAAVSAALLTLADLQAVELSDQLPDISGSLTLLISISKRTASGEQL